MHRVLLRCKKKVTESELEAKGASCKGEVQNSLDFETALRGRLGFMVKHDANVQVKPHRTRWLLRHKGRHRDQG